MNRSVLLFLRVAVGGIGVTFLLLSVFWLPWLASLTVERFPEYAFLRWPVLIGLYVTTVPFFFAVGHAWKLTGHLGRDGAFSKTARHSLQCIAGAAAAIVMVYVLGMVYLGLQSALHPGIFLIGAAIILLSILVAVYSTVLNGLFAKAMGLEKENKLTV